ncbi:metalloregulator ArsR/SmtB family transcription factor [Kribbella sp. NBC_01484]|uniref:ArsR/SmtB family transcription factor n=1 Tax=Kribbella sp. NBC_01484 TaxID=2903579 RepID=UPI002E350561|nr:metalloregulator ArsR/SmtB family transcription factor [Kribbella sp. NBC_01484]
MTIEVGAVLTAVADGSRRRIVARLAQGPATTGQLAELFPISRPAVSQHLKILQTADLVRTTLVGRHRWHELNPDALHALAHWAIDVAARHEKAPPLRRTPGAGPPAF